MYVKAHLHDAIFAYDCRIQLADAIPAIKAGLSTRHN